MKALGILLALAFGASTVTHATIWQRYPLAGLLRDHPLVVVGKIVRVKQAWYRGEAFDIAYIRIELVLKNTLQKFALRAEVPLWMPSTRDETMSTADVSHDLGADGIWFLSAPDKRGDNVVPTGALQTRHPSELQPRKLQRRAMQLLQPEKRANPALHRKPAAPHPDLEGASPRP